MEREGRMSGRVMGEEGYEIMSVLFIE